LKLETKNPFSSLKIKEFRYLLQGRFFFVMALRMMGSLLGWWIYILTKDPLAIGFIGLAEVIPAISLALYAGYVIDISEKRKLLLTCVALYFLAALGLLCISFSNFLNLQKSTTIYIIYAIVFCTGIFRAFAGPSFGTLVGLIVPKNQLPNGISWHQASWLVASVAGHAIVGFLIDYIGISYSLLVIVLLVLIGFVNFLLLKKHPTSYTTPPKISYKNITEGLRFVLATKEVLGALSLDLFAVFFGGIVAIIPIYTSEILHVGAKGFGWLNAATDLGAIISVIALAAYPMKQKQGKKLLISVAGFGVCILVFALSTSFILSFIALVVSGILDGVSVVVRGTIVQLKTPENMKGRVMSVSSMFINSSNELGQFESGVAAKLMGTVGSVVFGGFATIGIVVYSWYKAPQLKEMEY
jgi:MFS family permease